MFSFFERLTQPFPKAPPGQPPTGIVAFCKYYTQGMWGVIATVSILSAIVAVLEVALFSNTPLFHIDFGYLIYRRDHPQRQRIEQARSFEDLQGLTFIGQQGAEWERDNIPATLDTLLLGHTDTMMHMLVRRQTGDFMVMPAEQAVHIAKQLGYEDQIAFEPVRFIPNASIPFHVGIHSAHPDAIEMLTRIDSVLDSLEFSQAVDRILASYR